MSYTFEEIRAIGHRFSVPVPFEQKAPRVGVKDEELK